MDRRRSPLLLLLLPPLAMAACASDDTTTDTLAAAPTTAAATSTAAPSTTTAAPTPRFDQPGPYAVGVTTIDLGDRLAEIWYPVDPAVVDGQPTEVFDTLTVFPDQLRALIPAELQGTVDTGAVRDAPVSADGPFPVVVYSHGFGGFRQAATGYTRHIASWGFVVASTDHLERGIAAQATGQLRNVPDQDVRDVDATLDALAAGDLAGSVDLEQVAITGHSAGAGTAARAASQLDRIDAFVSISGAAPDGGETPDRPALVVVAENDSVVAPESSTALYEDLGPPKWLVEVADAGHNSFTDSCARIRDLGGLQSLVELIGEAQVARGENGCTPADADPALVWRVNDHYTVAFLRTFLGVEDDTASLAEDVTAEIGGITLSDLRAQP